VAEKRDSQLKKVTLVSLAGCVTRHYSQAPDYKGLLHKKAAAK
jgi:hypothetical protein